MKKKLFVSATLMLFLSVATSPAAQTVRELWDHVWTSGSDRPINQVNDGSTSFGFAPGVNWFLHRNTPLIQVDQNNELGPIPGLPQNAGQIADLWSQCFLPIATYTDLGLVDTKDPRQYGLRELVPGSQINFSANGVYYFAAGLWHGGDSCLGIGFASGTNASSRFVGAGISWSSYQNFNLTNELGVPYEVGNTLYLSTGTLDQPDDGMLSPTGYPVLGPAYVRAFATNAVGFMVHNGTAGVTNPAIGLLVAKLTTTAAGNATLQALWMTNGSPLPTDDSAIVWDVTCNFTETSLMTHFLLWQNSGYNAYPFASIDAMRAGTAWRDVIGVEVSKVVVAPSTTVPTGTPVTFTATASLAPLVYQWQVDKGTGATNIVDATNAVFSLSYPVTTDSGTYTLVVSNSYGTAVSSPVALTVTPPTPPGITQQPVSAKRYAGAKQVFSVGVNGTPPYTYQWHHAGTNVPPPAGTNASLVLNNLTAADEGDYDVLISTPFPPATNSATATLTLITPPAGSFAEAALAHGADSIWEFSELLTDPVNHSPAGLVLHDYAGGRDGICPDTNNVTFGLDGPPYQGFPGATSLQVHNNGQGQRVNLPVTLYSNNMTMMFWANGSFYGSGLMLNTDGLGSNPGDGPYFGIDYRPGSLGSQWGSGASMWGSGITLPLNQWVFVALVVEPLETTVYAGTDPATLQMVTRSFATGTNLNNNTATRNGPLTMGRTDYSWASPGNAWAGSVANFADAAIYYQSLPPTAITNLFLSGVGVQLLHTADAFGNLTLNWLPGGSLQEATNVSGPYVDVTGATPPWFVTMTEAQRFYRVKR